MQHDRKGVEIPFSVHNKMVGDWNVRMRKEETKRSSSDDSMFNVQCIWTNSSINNFIYFEVEYIT